jgi:hypothetical protein
MKTTASSKVIFKRPTRGPSSAYALVSIRRFGNRRPVTSQPCINPPTSGGENLYGQQPLEVVIQTAAHNVSISVCTKTGD